MSQPDQSGPTFGDMEGTQTFGSMEGASERPEIALAPLDGSRHYDVPTTPQGVDRTPDAPEVADFPLDEAPRSEIEGDVVELGERIRHLVLNGARRHAQGDRAEVTSILMPIPDPGDPTGQTMALGVMVVLSAPGMILNTRLINSKIIPFVHGWTQELADEQMREVWEETRKQRSAQPETLAQMQRDARNQGPTQNGFGDRLIVPGM